MIETRFFYFPGIFGRIFSISLLFPASQIALIARRPAAGAANTAMYWVMLVKYGASPPQVPKVQVLESAPIPTSVSAAIKNVGTFSCVIVPSAKNDNTPTMNPSSAKIPAT